MIGMLGKCVRRPKRRGFHCARRKCEYCVVVQSPDQAWLGMVDIAGSKRPRGYGHYSKPFVHSFPAAANHDIAAGRPHRSSRRDGSLLVSCCPPCVSSTSSIWSISSERMSMALLLGCPPQAPTLSTPRRCAPTLLPQKYIIDTSCSISPNWIHQSKTTRLIETCARRRRSGGGPEGSALVSPSASPHLPVVGPGNPVAVPGLAR
jgi:hypothetical protein